MKNYKLQAVLTTIVGELEVYCEMAEDGVIDGKFKDSTGVWHKEFLSQGDVRDYLHNSLRVKNVIRMVEVMG